MKTGKSLTIVSLLCLMTLGFDVRRATARTAVTPELRVKSNQVLVPTFVYKLRTLDSPAPPGSTVQQTCSALSTLQGLNSRNFNLFDDGIEQSIQNVTAQRWPLWWTFDSRGSHMLYISTPKAKWDTVDMPSSVSGPFCPSYFYQVAFVPPPSPKGSCHTIKVVVNRKHVIVWNRSLYCNVPHSASDPLKGTPFGRQMEHYLDSRKPGKIRVSMQAGFFYTGAGHARVYLALSFPWQSLWYMWKKGKLYASIAVLGMVYKEDGTLAARFSSWWWDSHDFPDFVQRTPGNSQYAYPSLNPRLLPAHCETEVNLPPGQYKLRVVLSDGKEYGVTAMPLEVPKRDETALGLSSVFLARHYHVFRSATPEPSRFIPLISNGTEQDAPGRNKPIKIEVVPTGKTAFRRGTTLMAYFQVYAPRAGENSKTTVQVHMRIVDLKTGKVRETFKPFNLAHYRKAGSKVIGVGRLVPLASLPKGEYRLDVEASDSTGRRTPWRSADFTIGHAHGEGFWRW